MENMYYEENKIKIIYVDAYVCFWALALALCVWIQGRVRACMGGWTDIRIMELEHWWGRQGWAGARHPHMNLCCCFSCCFSWC